MRGDHDRAHALLDTSVLDDKWEPTVADCLRALLTPARPPRHLLDRYTATSLSPKYNHFTVRLGLAIIDLLESATTRTARNSIILRRIVAEASADAYIARDILRHPVADELTDHERNIMLGTMCRAGLANPPPLEQLTTRLQIALTGT